jgi:hypothetical protein
MQSVHGQPGSAQTITLTVHSAAERLVVEQALLMIQELRAVTQAAEPGKVLERCEDFAIDKGRQLTRLAIETASQEVINDLEKNFAAADLRPLRRPTAKQRNEPAGRANLRRGYYAVAASLRLSRLSKQWLCQ